MPDDRDREGSDDGRGTPDDRRRPGADAESASEPAPAPESEPEPEPEPVPMLVGVDAGTTNVKAVAFGLDGTRRARAVRSTPVASPRPGWAEQDPDRTWALTAATLREVTGALGPGEAVVGVGVTGQGGGCWLVDGDGEPVRDAILWSDGRAAGVVADWRADGTADELFRRCGYGVFPGLAAPVCRWLRAEAPGTLDRAETLVACKDWLGYRLTGRLASDPSDASLWHLDPTAGDRGRGRFDREAAALAGVPELADLEPPLIVGDEVLGEVTPGAAAATGLPAGTPVAAGVMDVAASAFGSGAVAPGDTSAVVGTTLQAQRLLAEPSVSPPPTGYLLALGIDGMGLRAMGAMTGTPNVDWAVEVLAAGGEGLDDPGTDRSGAEGGATSRGDDPYAAVEAAARAVPPGAGGVLYHPYLSAAGEKAPFVAPDARAGFTGLRPDHTRGHLLRAVYEGVALALRDCEAHLPGETERIVAGGGGTRSAFWCRLFADCLDATLAVPAGTEFGARGAAILAGVATGRYADVAEGVDRATGVDRVYEPRPARAAVYDRWYDAYLATREALTDAWTHRAAVLEGVDVPATEDEATDP